MFNTGNIHQPVCFFEWFCFWRAWLFWRGWGSPDDFDFVAVLCCFLLFSPCVSHRQRLDGLVVSKTCVNFHPHVLISDYIIMQTHWCSYDIVIYHVDVLHIFARGVAQPPFRQDGDGLPWSGERWRSHSNFWLHGPSGQRNVAKLAKPWSDLGDQNGDFQGFPI